VYFLDFFSGTKSEQGKSAAEDFVVTTIALTNTSGIALFDVPLPATGVTGSFLLATATDPKGNTSEFSNTVPIQQDSNGDGIPDALEAGAANNNPAIAVFQNTSNGPYLTLAAPAGTTLTNVTPLMGENPSPDDTPANAAFPFGFLSFQVHGLTGR